jgi:hypothetical protein
MESFAELTTTLGQVRRRRWKSGALVTQQRGHSGAGALGRPDAPPPPPPARCAVPANLQPSAKV